MIVHQTLIGILLSLTAVNCGATFTAPWIWSKGCMISNSNNTINNITIEENDPVSCFEACGDNVTIVALQGLQCGCLQEKTFNVNYKRVPPLRHCTERCVGNNATHCGQTSLHASSLYEKASPEDLRYEGLSVNDTGCVSALKKPFGPISLRAQSCNAHYFGICFEGTLCRRSDANQTWFDVHNCFGNLISSVQDFQKEIDCDLQEEFWIGLFRFDKHVELPHTTASHDMLVTSEEESTVPDQTTGIPFVSKRVSTIEESTSANGVSASTIVSTTEESTSANSVDSVSSTSDKTQVTGNNCSASFISSTMPTSSLATSTMSQEAARQRGSTENIAGLVGDIKIFIAVFSTIVIIVVVAAIILLLHMHRTLKKHMQVMKGYVSLNNTDQTHSFELPSHIRAQVPQERTSDMGAQVSQHNFTSPKTSSGDYFVEIDKFMPDIGRL